MIEKNLLDYLNEMSDVPVYMEKPKNHPKRYAILEKTASSEENFVFTSTFALQSYAESLYQAALLNDRLKTIMLNKEADIPDVSSVSLSGDYNFTDNSTKEYRYQMVLIIVHF